MLKCNNCKNHFTEVKDCFGTKLCFKCYSIDMENDNAKLKTDIFERLPKRYQKEIMEKTNGEHLLWNILKTYLDNYISDLKAGKHE